MSETTFERVRRVATSTSEKEINPNDIKPESTLEELGLVEFFWGAAPFFVYLENEFRKDNPKFDFPNVILDGEDASITIQQIVDLVEEGLAKATELVTR